MKHNEILIEKEEPFKHCQLKRLPYAEVLMTIVESYSEGFVLAINNEWGAGKTTFIKMWEQLMRNNKFHTLYFNAWENDFENSPLVSLLSEFKKLSPKNEDTFKKVVQKATKISKGIAPILLKALAEKYIKVESVKDAIAKVSEDAMTVFQEEIDEFANKKKGLLDFKKELDDYISTIKNDLKPLVFIIDELDRCRPDYAVEILEQIKHFFSIKGIVFVLAIDKEQLGNSIRGFYGSDRIDANEYLRRFIDLEYVIPAPEPKQMISYLYDYFKFDDFFESSDRNRYSIFQHDKRNFIYFATELVKNKTLTLRQQEKLFSHCRLTLKLFKINEFVFPSLLFFLIYLNQFESHFFKRIISFQLTISDLVSEIERIIPSDDANSNNNLPTHTETLFIKFYYNEYRNKNYMVKLIENEAKDNESLAFDTKNEGKLILAFLKDFRGRDFSGLSLIHFINKVNLIDRMIH